MMFTRKSRSFRGRRAPVVAAVLVLALGACSDATRAEGPEPGVELAQAETGLPATNPYGDFLAARQAERDFDFARAAELYSRSLKASPGDAMLLRAALNQEISAGHIGKAAALARRVLKTEPDSVIAGLTVAIDDIIRGQLGAAEKRLVATPQHGLGGYFVPLALAWTRVGLKDYDGALQALEPLAKLRGGNVFHDYHAALILDLKGDDEGAAVALQTLAGDNYAGYNRIVQLAGAVEERLGHKDKAREIYQKFLASQPGSIMIEDALARLEAGKPPERFVTGPREGVAEGLTNMATLLNQENVPEIAMMLAQMSLALHPGFGTAMLLRGDIFDGAGRVADAIASYDRVPPGSSLGWAARLRAAQLLDREGKTEVALARLRDMAAERPKRTDALIEMGDLLRYKKRYDAAVDAYDAAFKRLGTPTERDWGLYYSRGIVLERSHHWKRAEADFLKALQFRPDQPYVLNYLGYSWVERGIHLKRALAMIEKAVKLRPNDGYIVDSLGWAHYQLHDYKKAVSYLEHAVELAPEDSTINDHLGDAYWRVGRRLEARYQWERALVLGPEPEDVKGIEKKLAGGLSANRIKREAAGAESDRHGG